MIFFKSDRKRKNKLLHRIDTKDATQVDKDYSVDTNDAFVEQSTSAYAQIKKLHWSFLDLVDNSITSLVPSSIIVIEILDEMVTVAILAKKGVFLDIKYLKKYSFEDLHIAHQKIISQEVAFDRIWYEELENIFTIVSYDIIYTIPSKVVIIENRFSDFYNIQIDKGRFLDKAMIKNALKREFESLSGYSDDDVYMTVTQRSGKKKDELLQYIVSASEKEYFDRIDKYLDETDFSIKKLHSFKSSLYSSFFADDRSKMRLHIEGSIAYMMQKYPQTDFEYQQLNLETDFSVIEMIAHSIDETILSGSGAYYEKLKQVFVDAKVNFRVFGFVKDLNRTIIRLEKGVSLDNGFATVVAVGYHELFKINFSSIRLGVSKKPSVYDHIYNNINFLPFAIVLLVLMLSYGTFLYLQYEYERLQKSNMSVSSLMYQESEAQESLKQRQNAINRKRQEIEKIKDIFAQKRVSEDAIILDEIAANLPNDMILTRIEKKTVTLTTGRRTQRMEPVIYVTGKSYFEHSLLDYINSMEFENKKVYLKSLRDDKKTQASQKQKNDESIFMIDTIENEYLTMDTQDENAKDFAQSFLERIKQIQAMNLEAKEVYFSDTLNNTFVLEIK